MNDDFENGLMFSVHNEHGKHFTLMQMASEAKEKYKAKYGFDPDTIMISNKDKIDSEEILEMKVSVRNYITKGMCIVYRTEGEKE